MEQLQRLRGRLDQLAAVLGLNTTKLAEAERVDEIRFTDEAFPVAGFSRLPFAIIDELRDLCGPSLTMAVRFDAAEVWSLSPETVRADLVRLAEDIREQPTVTFEILLNKDSLPERWAGQPPCAVCHLFLFAQRFREIVDGTVGEPDLLETLLWNSETRGKCAVILADSDLLLDGPGIAVVGVGRVEEWKRRPPPGFDSERIIAVYRSCRELVRWERTWFIHITPRLLRIDFVSDEAAPIAQAILRHWANAVTLFLADRVREEGQSHVALFVTEQRRTQITLADAKQPDVLHWEEVRAWGDVSDWAYEEPQSGNRIRMTQAAVAQSLSQLRQSVPMSALLAQAPLLWRDLQWNWKTFIGSEIERYTTEERELEEEVSETIARFDDEVAEMIKSLTSTMLGAVGALIGSLLAAAFKDPFNPLIFRAGIVAFMVYVVLFPGTFGLTHHAIRFRTIQRIYDRRRNRYARDMGVERVTHIESSAVDQARRRFWSWFAATLAALFVVTALGVVAIWKVPDLVVNHAPQLPALTPISPAIPSATSR